VYIVITLSLGSVCKGICIAVISVVVEEGYNSLGIAYAKWEDGVLVLLSVRMIAAPEARVGSVFAKRDPSVQICRFDCSSLLSCMISGFWLVF
jgi:hypothetical protein